MLKRALQKVMANACKLGLTPAELDVAGQYLEHREYGLCFDTIVTQLYERAIAIDPARRFSGRWNRWPGR